MQFEPVYWPALDCIGSHSRYNENTFHGHNVNATANLCRVVQIIQRDALDDFQQAEHG
jgi:hypothetical protein